MFYLESMILLSFFIVFKFYHHFLMILISLEFLVVNIIVLMMISMYLIAEEVFVIYFLVYSICDSVIGLALVILISRIYGNEKSHVINIKMW